MTCVEMSLPGRTGPSSILGLVNFFGVFFVLVFGECFESSAFVVSVGISGGTLGTMISALTFSGCLGGLSTIRFRTKNTHITAATAASGIRRVIHQSSIASFILSSEMFG